MTDKPPPDLSGADRIVEGGMKTIMGCLAIPIVGIIGFTLLTSTCSPPTYVPPVANDTEPMGSIDTGPAPTPAKVLTFSDRSMICRAGIATVMGRDPKTMRASTAADDVVRIQYRRADDGKLWKSECRVVGNRIIWRGIDSSGNDGPGRWRDGPEDEALSFVLDGKNVKVSQRYSDGSVTAETFTF